MTLSDAEIAPATGPVNRARLLAEMLELLRAALDAQGEDHSVEPTAATPLLGSDGVLLSVALVTYVLDVEALLGGWGVHITLASEAALSRRRSPFRTVETLADYAIELASLAGPR